MAVTTTEKVKVDEVQAAVDGLTNSDGDGGWVAVGARGAQSFCVLVEANVNPGGAVTVTLEGAEDAAGAGASIISAAAGFGVAASITTGGAGTMGVYRIAPPYVRVKQHADGTGDLRVTLCAALPPRH